MGNTNKSLYKQYQHQLTYARANQCFKSRPRVTIQTTLRSVISKGSYKSLYLFEIKFDHPGVFYLFINKNTRIEMLTHFLHTLVSVTLCNISLDHDHLFILHIQEVTIKNDLYDMNMEEI